MTMISPPPPTQAQTQTMTSADPARPAAPRHDPVSVRAVLQALASGQRMTGADLRMASGLPRRTVYEALRTLRRRGVVLQRQSLHDSRQTYFWLAEVTSGGPAADAHAFGQGGSAEPAVPSH